MATVSKASTEQKAPLSEGLKQAWKDIDSYWFSFGSATTFGIFRILLGLCLLFNLLLVFLDFDAWFSERGFVPLRIEDLAQGPIKSSDVMVFAHNFTLPFTVPRLNLLSNVSDTRITFAFYILIIISAITTTLGLWTRVSSIILALGMVTLQHRNILILHGGDTVLRLAAMYIAIAPSGAACSLDRIIALWKGEKSALPARVSIWPQRIIQYNVALIYFTTWWLKMDGHRWRNGTAVWFPAHLNEFHRFWVPSFIQSVPLTNFFTYMTLAVELSLGTLVFYRPARRYVLMAGIGMHSYIEYSMNIPMFAFSICSMYIIFYQGEEIAAWAVRLGERFRNFAIEVRMPVGKTFLPGPALALQAMDPLGLVHYVPGTSDKWEATYKGKELPRPVHAAWWRSVGAAPIGVVPGLWRKILDGAITPSASEVVKK